MTNISKDGAEIAQEISDRGLRVVRQMVNPPARNNRNIIAYNESSGDLVWEIAPISTIYDDSPYIGMKVEDGRLLAFNWDGSNVVVCWETGAILERIQGK